MKFLFVQKSGLPWHGVMSLSAILKREGIDTDLIMTDEDKPLPHIRKYSPDFIGFHVLTGEHPWVMRLCKSIRENFPKVRIVLGGPHATSCPEDLAGCADYVVQGEADVSLPDVCGDGRLPTGVVPLFPLVQDLSSLPMPDRTIYYKYPHLAKSTVKQFLTGRGCPYSCSFCINHLARKLYRGQKWVRRRTPEDVITELVWVKSLYGFRTISFSDDVFSLDKRWLAKFLPLYKSEVKSPFLCNIRCDLVDSELIGTLKDAGCYGLEMGVESGSERIRWDILNKGKVTNRQIVKAGSIVKKRGLMLKTFNMIGIPTETLEDCFRTIAVNTTMQPDHASCTFLVPYPKYAIAEHYKAADQSWEDSYLKPPVWVGKQVVNLQTFFFILVKFPRMAGLVRLLMRIPPNAVYRVAAQLFYGVFMARCHKLTLGDMVRYGLHMNPFRL